MSMSISFVGKFFNGKTRAIGSFVSTNGLNNSKLYLNEDDVLFILKVADMENKSFNYCIDNNKFKELVLYADYEGGSMKEKITLTKLNKQIVTEYVNRVNALAKEGIKKVYNRPFNYLTEAEKNKVFLNWSIMQTICKDEEKRIKEFNALINDNSRVDKYYNIIFNV